MKRHRVVSSFHGLLTPFTREVNAWCCSRTLEGDFAAIAARLAPRADDEGGVLEVDAELLEELRAVDARAVAVLREDLRRLTELGREPQLNVITHYPPDTRGLPVSVDVHSFHVDRAPIEADTFLCTYAGACSEGLENEDASRLVDDPHVREALRALHGRAEGFADFLVEQSFDLHFAMKPGATPFSFGTGHLWRVATAWPGAVELPCIHRAPPHDGRPRLLLIS
jgi:hypothetical protein